MQPVSLGRRLLKNTMWSLLQRSCWIHRWERRKWRWVQLKSGIWGARVQTKSLRQGRCLWRPQESLHDKGTIVKEKVRWCYHRYQTWNHLVTSLPQRQQPLVHKEKQGHPYPGHRVGGQIIAGIRREQTAYGELFGSCACWGVKSSLQADLVHGTQDQEVKRPKIEALRWSTHGPLLGRRGPYWHPHGLLLHHWNAWLAEVRNSEHGVNGEARTWPILLW